MRVAIFDIDGTLVAGSTERRFARYLARRGCFGPRQLIAYVAFWLRHGLREGFATAKKNKAYLAGLRVADVERLAADFVAAEVLDRLIEPALARLAAHLARGDTVLLMSGTLEAIARALAAALGVREVCATVCAEHGGRFSAAMPEVHPFGSAKLELARQWLAERGLTLERVAAYGNSRHDLALLEAAGTAVAVRPDQALARAARTRGWEIVTEAAASAAALRD